MPQTRQLAAIMFTDIVGYTALMGNDEQKAFELLKKNRHLHKQLIEQHNGTWIKELGDGVLASFSTVTDAVLCATALQKASSETPDLKLRVGIDQSEVVFEDGDVFGDGVNIASRLQALAPVGGIWISESVYKNVFNKKEVKARFVREEVLKNVKEPVRIYEIATGDAAIRLQPQPGVNRPTPAKKRMTAPKISRLVITTAITVFLIAVAALTYWLIGKTNNSTTSRIDSIAVLPFANETGIADMEYLSDGMTEMMINSLSQLQELSVKARSSVFRYKGKNIDPIKIGQELSVDAILNGFIAQRGDNITVNLELIDVKSNDLIWGEQYNRQKTDLITLQTEIVSSVSNKLQQKLTGAAGQNIAKTYTANSEAYQLYLRGLFHWNKRTVDELNKAIQYFNNALEKDPSFSLAYAGLAATYAVLPSNAAMSKQEVIETRLKAKAAALKALELDNTLAEAHSVLGIIKGAEWDFKGAEKDLLRALQLNPNYAPAHMWYSDLLAKFGRGQQGLAEGKRAYELDPFSPAVNMQLSLRYAEVNRYDEAINQLQKLIELAPDYWWAYWLLGSLYIKKGMYEEAITPMCTRYIVLKLYTQESAERKSARLRQALKSGGKKGIWMEILESDMQAYKKGLSSPVFVASDYAELGETDKAFEWLEKAYAERDRLLTYLKTNHFSFDSLRSDPRFQDLLQRVGLPQ